MAFDPLAELKRLPADTLLMLGDDGFAVRLLKRALSVHGFGPPEWKNFNKPIAAQFDEGLETVVISFQKAKRLEVDGVAGPNTLKALAKEPSATAPAADPLALLAPLREAAQSARGTGTARGIAAAKRALDLHIRETGGENRGPLVEAIQIYAARRRFYHWCVAFCDVCMEYGFEAAGERIPLNPGTSCSDLVRRAKALSRVFEPEALHRGEFPRTVPQAGDLFVLRGGSTGYKHIGIVVAAPASNGVLSTIEGNTNDQGSANGDGVYARKRDPKRVPAVLVRLS